MVQRRSFLSMSEQILIRLKQKSLCGCRLTCCLFVFVALFVVWCTVSWLCDEMRQFSVGDTDAKRRECCAMECGPLRTPNTVALSLIYRRFFGATRSSYENVSRWSAIAKRWQECGKCLHLGVHKLYQRVSILKAVNLKRFCTGREALTTA